MLERLLAWVELELAHRLATDTAVLKQFDPEHGEGRVSPRAHPLKAGTAATVTTPALGSGQRIAACLQALQLLLELKLALRRRRKLAARVDEFRAQIGDFGAHKLELIRRQRQAFLEHSSRLNIAQTADQPSQGCDEVRHRALPRAATRVGQRAERKPAGSAGHTLAITAAPSLAASVAAEPTWHAGTATVPGLAAWLRACPSPGVQSVQHATEASGHHGNECPHRTEDARRSGGAEHPIAKAHDARRHGNDEKNCPHARLPAAVEGLDASTPTSRSASTLELTPLTAAAITCWADIDTELDHLAGCYCAVANELPRPTLAAEACTEFLADSAPPTGRPPVAFLLAPFFDRWPRLSVLATLVTLLALLGLAGDPPEPPTAALEHLPSDGFPPELLAALVEGETPNSAAQAPQHVLKAEAATPDATDRGAPVITSLGGGPTGAGQPAAAGPAGGVR